MEKMQLGNIVNSELEAMRHSFSHDLHSSSPLWFNSQDINYSQNISYDLNESGQLREIEQLSLNSEFIQEQSATNLDFVANIPGGTQPWSTECLNPSLPSENAHVMNFQFLQNMNSGCGPFDQLQRSNEPLNNAVFQQHFALAPISSQVDPTGISVGASEYQNLEDNHESPGFEPQCDQLKDINVQLRLNDNQIPSAGSGMISLSVPQFVFEIPEGIPFDCWKVEILKDMEVVLDNALENFRNIELPILGKVTIGKKRAMQTVLSDFEEHDILKCKKVQGSTQIDFSYGTKMNIVEGTHDSKGILCCGIKNSANALSGEIVRNQTARGVIQKSTCIALSPQVEAHNVDSMQQISESSLRWQRRFSLDETKSLIDAVENYGIGGWQESKQKVFHTSDRTYNELKDKWRSLVKTATRPPAKRRGPVIPQDLLYKVLCIAYRGAAARLQGKPL